MDAAGVLGALLEDASTLSTDSEISDVFDGMSNNIFTVDIFYFEIKVSDSDSRDAAVFDPGSSGE